MRQHFLPLLLLLLSLELRSQSFSVEDVKSYPFPTELTASARGARIAWAFDKQGKRNVYVAEGPDFKARKLTAFNEDDGQEITSLQVSKDGKWVVFVRGGDHGSNWDEALPVNPSFSLTPYKVQINSIPFEGGELKSLGEGDEPVIHPSGKTVTFIKGGQAFETAIDGSTPAKSLFQTRGTVSQLKWMADGSKLAFVVNRGDHSFIGVYAGASAPISWVAPSFHRDSSPRWSPDGSSIAFIRQPGTGGAPDSILVRRHNPWSVMVAGVGATKANVVWKAPATLRGSLPTTHGGTNLHWTAGNRIVFLSYHDGWPHLYSIPSTGGKETLLTPGNFMVEHVSLTADGRHLTFSANTGSDDLDLERRHAVRVAVDQPKMEVLTPGNGLEWTPVQTGDGTAVAMISATAQRPPLPAIVKLNTSSKAKDVIQLIAQELIPKQFPLNDLVTPRQVIFQSPDGVAVHADLFEPKANAKGRRPAIVYIHGGPPRQMLLGWHYSDYYSNAYAMNQYLCQLGYVVLAVNYRLGIGYGYEFHQPADAGALGASEYQDIKAAGEWLARQPQVDAQRIGVYGGSYGGYLTSMALGRDSKLFAAGVDVHGVHDYVNDRGHLFPNTRFEKAPDLEKAKEVAWRSSPISSVNTWASPVLIIHADDDRNVRFNQSTDLVRRLEKKGVEIETLVIVDDTHHWMKYSNAVLLNRAIADFFMKKLGQ